MKSASIACIRWYYLLSETEYDERVPKNSDGFCNHVVTFTLSSVDASVRVAGTPAEPDPGHGQHHLHRHPGGQHGESLQAAARLGGLHAGVHHSVRDSTPATAQGQGESSWQFAVKRSTKG
jgi:hypothetical protein